MNQPPIPTMRIEESGYLLHPPYGNRYVAIQVDPTQWTHVCSARFGPGRPCSFSKQTKWTGDSYRYDIFIRPEHRQISLRWFNGSGEGWLIAEDKNERGERSLLDHIAQLPDEARRWDFCHFIWSALSQTRRAVVHTTEDTWEQAILQKQITIRKRNGRRTASIKPQIIGLAHTVSTFTL